MNLELIHFYSSSGSLPAVSRAVMLTKGQIADSTDQRVGGWEKLVESAEHLGQVKHQRIRVMKH